MRKSEQGARKNMTVRLPDEVRGRLDTISVTRDVPVAELIREALADYLAKHQMQVRRAYDEKRITRPREAQEVERPVDSEGRPQAATRQAPSSTLGAGTTWNRVVNFDTNDDTAPVIPTASPEALQAKVEELRDTRLGPCEHCNCPKFKAREPGGLRCTCGHTSGHHN